MKYILSLLITIAISLFGTTSILASTPANQSDQTQSIADAHKTQMKINTDTVGSKRKTNENAARISSPTTASHVATNAIDSEGFAIPLPRASKKPKTSHPTTCTVTTASASGSGGATAVSPIAAQQQNDAKSAQKIIVPESIVNQMGKNNAQVIAWINKAPQKRKNAYVKDNYGDRPILVKSLKYPDIFNALVELEADTITTHNPPRTTLDFMLLWKIDISKIDVSRFIALMLKQGAKLDELKEKVSTADLHYSPGSITLGSAAHQPFFDFQMLYDALEHASVKLLAQEAEKVITE